MGETSYNVSNLEKYKEAIAAMDLGKFGEKNIGASYSQLFQSSGVIQDTASKLNISTTPDKGIDTLNKFKGLLPPIVNTVKFKDEPKKELTIKQAPKDPKVQVVRQGHNFDRRKTFIKNWEFEEDDKDEDAKDNE